MPGNFVAISLKTQRKYTCRISSFWGSVGGFV